MIINIGLIRAQKTFYFETVHFGLQDYAKTWFPFELQNSICRLQMVWGDVFTDRSFWKNSWAHLMNHVEERSSQATFTLPSAMHIQVTTFNEKLM